jgi:hypothetical protein
MIATTTGNGVKPPIVKRARHTVPLAVDKSREAKRLAAAILEVLAGSRTPQQAADALGMSLSRYYQVEARALQALLTACEAKPKGRQPDPHREIAEIQRENERLRREVSRQQSLARMQRSLGLPPPAPPPKVNGKKARRRKPAMRALNLAARLQQEARQDEAANDTSAAPTTAT